MSVRDSAKGCGSWPSSVPILAAMSSSGKSDVLGVWTSIVQARAMMHHANAEKLPMKKE